MPVAQSSFTVDVFSELAEDGGAVYHELHHGEIVTVTRPKWKHFLVQRRIRRLLESLAELGSLADTEVAFRPLPEYELRVADVAWISAARAAQVDTEGYFNGVPELVVEVLSPSNSSAELEERLQICLSNGCLEFWIVDPGRNLTITTADGNSTYYHVSDVAASTLFRNTMIPVREITG